MQIIKLLTLLVAAGSMIACGKTPQVQAIDIQAVSNVKPDKLSKSPIWHKHLTGQVWIRNAQDKDGQLSPWDKGEVAAVLKAGWRTVAGEGKVYKNGFMSVDIDLKANVKTISFKKMLSGAESGAISLVSSPKKPIMERDCDFSNLKLSDLQLKVREGELGLNNGMPIAGTNDPKAKKGFAEMLYADRKSKVDGFASCKLKIGDKILTYEHKFFIDLSKGWNFLNKELSSDDQGTFKIVYKTVPNPTIWVANNFAGPGQPERPKRPQPKPRPNNPENNRQSALNNQ